MDKYQPGGDERASGLVGKVSSQSAGVRRCSERRISKEGKEMVAGKVNIVHKFISPPLFCTFLEVKVKETLLRSFA